MEILLLAAAAKIMIKGYTWSTFKHHSTADFFVFFALQLYHIKDLY